MDLCVCVCATCFGYHFLFQKKEAQKNTPMCYVMMVYTFSFMIENNNGKGVDFCRVTIFFGNWVLRKGLTALYIVCTSIKLNLSHKTLIYRRKKYVKVYTFLYVHCTSIENDIEGQKTIFIGL